MIHAEFIEHDGDLVDILYYCSAMCYELDTHKEAYGHGWPCGSETDYDVYCERCGDLLWEGLQNASRYEQYS